MAGIKGIKKANNNSNEYKRSYQTGSTSDPYRFANSFFKNASNDPEMNFWIYPYSYYLVDETCYKRKASALITNPQVCNIVYNQTDQTVNIDSGIDLWNKIIWNPHYFINADNKQYKFGYIEPGTRPTFIKQLYMKSSGTYIIEYKINSLTFTPKGSSDSIVYTPKDFSDGVIPKRLIVELQAGGGGGGATAFLGGGGGGGAGGGYGCYVLNIETYPSWTIEVGGGGAGGPYATAGYNGGESKIYITNKSSKSITLGGGGGGCNGYNDYGSSGGEYASTLTDPNAYWVINQAKGGNGQGRRTGPSSPSGVATIANKSYGSAPSFVEEYNQKTRGGTSGGQARYGVTSGAGGGSAFANGADDQRVGTLGAGGGGGDGIGEGANGCAGGAGVLYIWY